jgi:hypothetical protein
MPDDAGFINRDNSKNPINYCKLNGSLEKYV